MVWFSCGAASAVCAHVVLKRFRNQTEVVLAYTDPGTYDPDNGVYVGEHPDNKRFLEDCEEWLNFPITILKSEKYDNPIEVWEDRKYICGTAGAPCTGELKKKLRESFQIPYEDLQVFGFTNEEQDRADRFRQNNPEANLWTPLIDLMLNKADCLAFLKEEGIDLPAMYKLGYRNNNCIGCCKGMSGYWNKIRKDFPETFNAVAGVERKVGAAINKRHEGEERIRVFLDELPEGMGNYSAEPDIECGLLCQMARAKKEEDCEI